MNPMSDLKPLVLSRGPGESIVIGDDLVLTVLDVRPTTAAASVRITRGTDVRTVRFALDRVHPLDVDVEVTLVDVRPDRARLSVSAPRRLSIHRLEVYDSIREENRRRA